MPTGACPTEKLVAEPDPGSMRETRSLPVSVTQTAPSPTTTPFGRSPTVIGKLKRPSVSGLIRETLLSPSFATQIDRLPYAIAEGVFPATVVAVTRREAESIRDTLESPNATQTDPPPTVMLP